MGLYDCLFKLYQILAADCFEDLHKSPTIIKKIVQGSWSHSHDGSSYITLKGKKRFSNLCGCRLNLPRHHFFFCNLLNISSISLENFRLS